MQGQPADASGGWTVPDNGNWEGSGWGEEKQMQESARRTAMHAAGDIEMEEWDDMEEIEQAETGWGDS